MANYSGNAFNDINSLFLYGAEALSVEGRSKNFFRLTFAR